MILDTNVVSEPLKPTPDRGVQAWLDLQAPRKLYITAITVMEMLDGVGRLPLGLRRTALDLAIRTSVLSLFTDRILPFDHVGANIYCDLAEKARKAGHAVSMADCMIGAIAHAKGYVVATRDTGPFEAMGLPVINPWTAVVP